MKQILLGVVLFLSWGASSAFAKGDSQYSFYLQLSQAVSDFEQLPAGLEKEHLHTPFVLGMDFEVGSGPTRFFMDIHGGILSYTMAPAFGVALGPVMKIGVADLKILGEVESNGVLESEMSSSHLSSYRWGLSGELSVERGIFRPSIGLRWINVTSAQIADFENLPTKVAHSSTYVFKPGLIVKLPLLQAEATVAVYSLGKTAVTSKDFTFPIDRQTVFRPSLGAGFDLPGVELWLRASAIYPVRSNDSVEYLYMAPLYVNDNMMTKKALTAEVRFNL